MSIQNSRLSLTNSKFEQVTGQNGACVYSDSKISFYSLRERLLSTGPIWDTEISNCQFFGNLARSSGGVLFLKNVNTNILNSWFQLNNATQGGVIYADITDQDKKIFISQSSFNRNAAKKKGAIDVSVNQPIAFDNNDFVDNLCQDYLNTDVYEPDYLAL